MRISYFVIPLLIGAATFGWYWKYTHPDIVSVVVTTAHKGDVESTVANTRAGTIKACRRAKLSPSSGGQISELPFEEGDFVEEGAVLLTIWNKDLLAEIDHIKETIIVAKGTAKARCLQANVAERSADRARKLVSSRTISREEYDNANTEAQVRVAECQMANDSISVAQASLKVAEAQLKRTILYAPFDGVIAKINGELNEYVTPSPVGVQTPPVIDLIEPGCFLVSVPVDEVDAPKIKVGMLARVTLDAWRGHNFEASVSRIGTYVVDSEKQARTVDIELVFKNKKDLANLLVGYSADADVILEVHNDVLRIPSEAILEDSNVLLFNPDTSILEKKIIKKGLNNWSYTEILEGIKEGDKLVTSLGKEGVTDGVLAKIETEDNSNIGDKIEDKLKTNQEKTQNTVQKSKSSSKPEAKLKTKENSFSHMDPDINAQIEAEIEAESKADNVDNTHD